MAEYLLSVHPDAYAAAPNDEVQQQAFEDVDALNQEMQEAGAWVFAGGLHEPDTATVVSVENGEVTMTDGPFAETKEHIGGFWVIDVGDLDEALDWAARATAACRLPVEVRPFQGEPETG